MQVREEPASLAAALTLRPYPVSTSRPTYLIGQVFIQGLHARCTPRLRRERLVGDLPQSVLRQRLSCGTTMRLALAQNIRAALSHLARIHKETTLLENMLFGRLTLAVSTCAPETCSSKALGCDEDTAGVDS